MPAGQPDHSQTLLTTRRAGVCLHITSLPGRYGVGEIGDAALAFADAMVSMGLSVWQFLPTGPTAYGDSPYQPLSTFAGNELLIDSATLIRTGLLTSNEADRLLDLPRDTVDYGRLVPLKRDLLARAASRFHSVAKSTVKADFDAFLAKHDDAWLNDYALFRLLKTDHQERPWYEWPQAYRERDAAKLAAVEAGRAPDIEAIKIQQFLFDRQWQYFKRYANEQGISLFGDMPIYLALDSADVWADRGLCRLDENGQPIQVAGVPPDYFSEDGQLWGNPLYDWERHDDAGYRWWVARLRRSAGLADIVRIDHFRGLESYWAVPARAETARTGEWLPGPGDAIFAAFRSELGELPIVAEDLGVITPAVEALRDGQGIPGMRVLQFEVGDQDFDLDGMRENCVCYTGTHDNDTTVGWFRGSPNDLRTEEQIERTQAAVLGITGGSAETVHKDMIKLAFSSPAKLAVAPLQDFFGLGSEARLNTPGTSTNNWRWRFATDDLTPALRAGVADSATMSGRA